MITLQFVSDASIFGELIQWYTRSVFTHVDIVMPDGWLTGARLKGGVRTRPPNYLPFNKIQHFVITLPGNQETVFYDALREQMKKPYDWTAILGFVADRNWRDQGHWFCSELVAWLFEQAGTPLLRIANTDKVTPRDLTTSLLLRPV